MNVLNLIDLQAWCREYERDTRWPCTIMERFAISFYQVHQGMDWHLKLQMSENPNRDESLCAAFLHLLMVAERMEVGVEVEFKNDLSSWSMARISDPEWSWLVLRNYSHCQQMIWYWLQSTRTRVNQRASRYSVESLGTSMIHTMGMLIGPVRDRGGGMITAMKIMTGDLK